MTSDSAGSAGTPIWVDLGSSDLGASKEFYSRLMGWDAFTIPDPAAGGYTMFLKDGKQVAALGGLQNPQGPSAWSIYIGADDADAVAARVREAGGQVIAEPFDVLDAGRMSVLQDPTGAFISIWQPGEMRGADLLDQPGSLCWSELNTRDLDTAQRFYGAVFGWTTQETTTSDGVRYLVWNLGDSSVAGAVDMGTEIPAEVPPHWLPYFAVEDCDAALAAAQELGGILVVGPMDTQFGRFTILSDPQGAVFAVLSAPKG